MDNEAPIELPVTGTIFSLKQEDTSQIEVESILHKSPLPLRHQALQFGSHVVTWVPWKAT